MRTIKFRAWDQKEKKMTKAWDLFDSFPGWQKHAKEEYKIMQYTGLKDKNGKEIYEGDIMNDDMGTPGVVSFDNGRYALDKVIPISNIKEKEIIGNIYENPELLT